jgi:hypothetical protein
MAAFMSRALFLEDKHKRDKKPTTRPKGYKMNSKMETLAQDWGLDLDENDTYRDLMFDGINPGICMNKDCNYSTDVEPDQDKGYCEECGTNTVKSASLLLGII